MYLNAYYGNKEKKYDLNKIMQFATTQTVSVTATIVKSIRRAVFQCRLLNEALNQSE